MKRQTTEKKIAEFLESTKDIIALGIDYLRTPKDLIVILDAYMDSSRPFQKQRLKLSLRSLIQKRYPRKKAIKAKKIGRGKK
jgi:hypothetical protein